MNLSRGDSPDALLPALGLLVLLFASGCDEGPVPDERRSLVSERREPLDVHVIQARRVENVPTIAICFGKLKPRREGRLGFGRGGRVKEVYKGLGDAADAGEVLAELEQGQLKDQKISIEREISRLKGELQTSPPAGTASLQARIRQLESQLKDTEATLANGVILAPYACIVTERDVETGSLASPAAAAFHVIEDAAPLVEAALPKEIAARANVGQPIAVIVGDEEIAATLKAKSPLLDEAASRTVLLEFAAGMQPIDWSFGQVVEIRLLLGTGNSGYWLPYSALQSTANGLWSVFVAEADDGVSTGGFRVGRRIVRIIQLEDEAALVRGALGDGESVISDGTHRVVVGQSVAPIDVSNDFEAPIQLGASE